MKTRRRVKKTKRSSRDRRKPHAVRLPYILSSQGRVEFKLVHPGDALRNHSGAYTLPVPKPD